MASGNFVIGLNLSVADFLEYVKPELEERSLCIPDYVGIYEGKKQFDCVLASLSPYDNKTHLEASLNDALIAAEKRINEKLKYVSDSERYTKAHSVATSRFDQKTNSSVPIGQYSVLGMYSDSETASKLFPVIASKYLLAAVEEQVKDVNSELDSLVERLS